MGPSTVEGMYAALDSEPETAAETDKKSAAGEVGPIGCFSGLIAMFGSMANGLDVLVNHIPRQGQREQQWILRQRQRQRQRRRQRNMQSPQGEGDSRVASDGSPDKEKGSQRETETRRDTGMIRRERRAVTIIDDATAERVQPDSERIVTVMQSLAEVLKREEARRAAKR